MHKLVEGVMTEVVPKEKPAKAKKKLHLPKLKYILVFVLVSAIVGLGAYLLLRDTRQVVDCKKIFSDASELYSGGKYQEYIGLVNPYIGRCIDEDKSTIKKEKIVNTLNNKSEQITVYHHLAMASSRTQQKTQALVFADKMLLLNKSLDRSESKNTQDIVKMVFDMYAVKLEAGQKVTDFPR